MSTRARPRVRRRVKPEQSWWLDSLPTIGTAQPWKIRVICNGVVVMQVAPDGTCYERFQLPEPFTLPIPAHVRACVRWFWLTHRWHFKEKR